MSEIFKTELIKETAGLSNGRHYYAVKFKTGSGINFTMRMTDSSYSSLLMMLSGDNDVERPHDSEIMKDFLSMIFNCEEN